ncbi:MAG TPA: hypothetical protein VFS76_16960 [Pyrinomonadaceae bacterium]|nr:hypothetical protein [Pyrinomonadaceae bacterium]
MKINFIHEPELEFGLGRHVDIRFGLMQYGPVDRSNSIAPKEIKLGIVGTPETIEGVNRWIEKCRTGIPGKKSFHPNLFPRFPGFGEGNLRADLIVDSKLEKEIQPSKFDELINDREMTRGQKLKQAVNMFLAELDYLKEKDLANVFVVAIPMNLLVFLLSDASIAALADRKGDDDESDSGPEVRLDFHHLLKARAMKLGKPLQLITPGTYDESKKLPQKIKSEKLRELQDEATRAWNFYTALYYKAGGIPWKVITEKSDLTVCYVGVSFFKTLDGSKLLTSTAQIFNERGDGIILRGGSAKQSKDDRQIHLDEENAFNLLNAALLRYKEEHRTLPARVVLHKTSSYDQQELDGFQRALSHNGVELFDLMNFRESFTRLYRDGEYPPLRGTLLTKNVNSHILYTRGGVDFYQTYTGMYIPRPLSFWCEDVNQTPYFLAREILTLTKMNWNATQFDQDEPITIKAARRVGDILKYVNQGEEQSRYSYYM